MSQRISVVIPARDRRSTIGAAIRSAQEQSLPPDEIVVVDDASRDDTAAVVEAMARSDARIRLLRSDAPGGAPAARNRGAAEAGGAILAFLDSDDVWRPEKLRLQMEVFDADDGTEVVGCHFAKVDEAGRMLVAMTPQPRVALPELVAYNLVGPTSILAIRRDAFEAVGGFDEAMPSCQDWELLARLAARADIRNVQALLVEQGVSSGNRITRDPSGVLEGHAVMHGRMRDHARARGLSEAQVRAGQAPARVELLLRHGMLGAAARLTARSPYPRSLAKWPRMLARGAGRLERS